MFNIFRKDRARKDDELALAFRSRYEAFQRLLHENNAVLELMADLEEKSSGDFLFDMNYIGRTVSEATTRVSSIITDLNVLSGNRYIALNQSFDLIQQRIQQAVNQRTEIPRAEYVLRLGSLTSDMTLIAGGKMANIGEMSSRLKLPVPEGFVITSSAFREFVAYNDLQERLSGLLKGLDMKDTAALEAASTGFQKLIMEGALPPELDAAIRDASGRLMHEVGNDVRVSVRSSAIAEDGHFSFAGQYATYLQVRPEEIPGRYRAVLASLFTPRALYYAASKGFAGEEMAMAVGVMRMIPARAGGVMYSQDPNSQQPKAMIINGTWGLAQQVVDGTGKTDRFLVARDSGEIIEQSISDKETMIAGRKEQGVEAVPVKGDLRSQPCLSPEQIRTLAGYALSLEQHFGKPQDIEWTVDTAGSVLLLQTRPLRVFAHESKKLMPRRVEGFPLLIEKGVIASRGIGCGRVYLVKADSDLANFPDNGVLVSRTTSTKFVTVMDRASAIVTDVGGATGHMASLAREYHLPAILDTDIATSVLRQGQEVTVDAINCNVYEGRVEQLLEYDSGRKDSLRETNLFHLLDQAIQFIVPLRLIDPESEQFRPESCTTLHDITRFSHEKAMSEMFGMSDTDEMEGASTISLAAGVPMDAHMIDVGGGMRPGVEKALPEDVLSVPYISFLKGLRGMKWPEPRAADAKGFLGMMAHAASITEEQLQQTAIRSFAIVSGNYMNFSIRLGYHFSMVEAFAGDTLNDNYVRFFFKGGGAATDRRLRRVRLIKELLEMLDFRVRLTEDVVNAVLLKFKRPEIERRLEAMGRMTVFTKQLDMAMYNDDITDWYRDEFVRDHLQPLGLGK
ncbi:MAG: phosphoenolpyruvate synthase [Thermodesulfovibrio sp.]|nr:phosphoenolpyruvate synthase [Thermodesulfovibrio sp.]